MKRFLLTHKALQDLEEIHDFIASESPAAALKLINLLEKKCKSLAKSPLMGRTRTELAPRLRSLPFGHYIIFYRPFLEGIEVIRVLHGAREIWPLFHK